MGAFMICWVLAGWSAWLWIMVRFDMADDFSSGVMAALMLISSAASGPFTWGVVAVAEYDERERPSLKRKMWR